jgi:LCP family protein required for cell wall assembly
MRPRSPVVGHDCEVKRSTLLGLLAVPVVIAGLYWLMLHGFLELTAYLLGFAVLALVVGAAWELRHGQRRWASVLLVGALVTAGTVGWYGWNLNQKLDNIQRASTDPLKPGERPPKPDQPTEAHNIRLMGADDPHQLVDKPTIAELASEGTWDPGAYRSDTMMVVHIPADRSAAYVVSVPRDSYLPIYDDEGGKHPANKVNDAFSAYGPYGTWRTIENFSGLRLDHMAIIDFQGFRDLTTAVGGVDVYIPQTVYDSKQHQQWNQGTVHLEGNLALKYVRMRYGLINGDFDRVDRQQNFLRALMEKVLANDTIGNPVKFTHTLDALTKHLTIDADWSNGEIRSLALSLQGLEAKNVKFVTLPFARYDTVDGVGSVNIVDKPASRQMWKAVADDTLGEWLKAHPDAVLPPPKKVS